MMNLSEHLRTATRLADFLPWAALASTGVVLNKERTFQRTARFRGPDPESAVAAERVDSAGRLGEVIEQDMIAVALSVEEREMVAAAPAYLQQYGRPERPRDLLNHRCIGWRPGHRVAPYRWEFALDGQAFSIAVEPQITSNDLRFLLRTALAGAGITFATAETFRPYIERGELISLLEDFLPPFPGFYLYFPHRTDLSPTLRAMVEHVRAARGTNSPVTPSPTVLPARQSRTGPHL